jgi:protein-arginine kinase activator protein McsA
MKEKKKHWESAQYSRLIDYYDFFNENLDKDIESVKELLSNVTQDIQRKTETKRKDSAINQKETNPTTILVNELNRLLQKQYQGRIEQDLALEKIQELIQSNTYSISSIQYISLDTNNTINDLKKLEKSKKDAIHNKDFEKAAFFRDLISTFELIDNFQSLSNEIETSSFFIYSDCILYFVVVDYNLFNAKIREFIENRSK